MAERQAREAADREILALKTEKQALEYRVINANRTLAYGLGRALIEARSVKGLFQLPGKIRRLRSKQRAKRRERVPNSFDEDISARLRLVEPALEQAIENGANAAADWVTAEQADSGQQARALAEIAHWAVDSDADVAGAIGLKAAAADPSETRLFSLAQRLRETGAAQVPAALCGAMRDQQIFSALQERLCDRMIEDGDILKAGAWTFPNSQPDDQAEPRDGYLLLSSARWQALPCVTECHQAAEKAGFTVASATSLDEIDLASIDVIHIFAASIAECSDWAISAKANGCRLILDFSNPPRWSIVSKETEMAIVEELRLASLAGVADQVIARSPAMARHFDHLQIGHQIVSLGRDVSASQVDDATVAAAFLEYGAKAEGVSIGIAATLVDDAGLMRCLYACAELGSGLSQILVFGKGDADSMVVSRAEALGITTKIQYVGLPPPQRWDALLGGIQLLLFPSCAPEPLGSEIPAILTHAVANGQRVLASEAAWGGQGDWKAGPSTIVPDSANWAEAVRSSLNEPAQRLQKSDVAPAFTSILEKLARRS